MINYKLKTVKELKEIAKKMKCKGYSKLKKADLIKMIEIKKQTKKKSKKQKGGENKKVSEFINQNINAILIPSQRNENKLFYIHDPLSNDESYRAILHLELMDEDNDNKLLNDQLLQSQHFILKNRIILPKHRIQLSNYGFNTNVLNIDNHHLSLEECKLICQIINYQDDFVE